MAKDGRNTSTLWGRTMHVEICNIKHRSNAAENIDRIWSETVYYSGFWHSNLRSLMCLLSSQPVPMLDGLPRRCHWAPLQLEAVSLPQHPVHPCSSPYLDLLRP